MRRSLLWRLHFWAALIATPFVVVACMTGLLYVFTPQIEDALYRHLDVVSQGSRRLALDDAVAAARPAAPAGMALHSVVPAHGDRDSVRVAFVPPSRASRGTPAATTGHESHAGNATPEPPRPAQFLRRNFGIPTNALVVYVDPYTARVLGTLPEGDRFTNWARKLHSSLLQGDNWRWMIELGASWMMVMLVTGILLWWPQKEQSGLPVSGATGRAAWRQWHAFVGIVLALVSLAMLTTGLTWSRTAGGQVRWARDLAGQAPPRIPGHFKSVIPEGAPVLGWEQAWQAIRQQAPRTPTQIMPPAGRDGFWRANHLEKKGEPLNSFDLLLDAYSGKPLYISGWRDQPAFSKATAVGIPFHRGEFGIWNQALLILFGAGVLTSLASGWVMVFKRLRAGGPFLPPLPPRAWRHTRPIGWLAGALFFAFMPLLAASAALVALAEAILAWRVHRPPSPPSGPVAAG